MNVVLLNLLLDLPLLAAVIVGLFPWFFPTYREEYGERAPLAPAWVALTICASTLGVALALAPAVFTLPEPLRLDYWWTADADLFHFGLRLDALSLFAVLAAIAAAGLAIVTTMAERRHTADAPAFHGGVLLLLGTVIGQALATDMIQFYFFWQGMLLVSTFLVAHGARSRRTGLLFFGVTQGGAALLLFALVAMASAARDWNIYAQGPLLVAQHPLWMAAMIVLLLVGFGTALGAAPFHRWLIRLGGGASPAVMILMTALMGTGAAYGLLRFVFSAFPYWGAMPLTSPVIVVAAAGQVYGAIRALRDTDPQRSVAWVAVSLAGFLLMAAATGFSGTEERGLAGAIVDLPQHAAAVILLLAGLGLKAAGRGRPGPAGQVAFICAFLALLGLAPIGPFAGNYLANGSALRLGGVFAVAAIVSWLAIALLAAYVWRAASAGTRPSIDISRPAFLRVVVAAVVVIVGALTAWSSSWMPFVERVALNLALRR